MKFDYTRSRATAQRLIDRFGQPAIVRRPPVPSGLPYDPNPGEFTYNSCTLVKTEYTSREVDGTLIRATDLKLLVSTASLGDAPKNSDAIAIVPVANANTQFLEIINVMEISPGGVIIMWEVQARG